MTSPINRTSAPQIIRLFDYCFKQGVQDARDLGDDYAAREWLDARLADGGYGTLPEKDFQFDWRRWRYTLYRWCREWSLGSLADNYLNRMERYKTTMAFALIPISMRFYMMGVEEWLEYPNPNNMALFLQNKRIHWKPVKPHLRIMTTADFRTCAQGFVYERLDRGYEGDMSANKYHDFCKALWRCTTKYSMINYGAYSKDEEDL